MPLSDARRAAVALLLLLVLAIASAGESTPYHTSSLSGQGWMLELLQGHPDRIHSELGLYHNTFYILLQELRLLGYGDSRHCSLEEQLGIFLYTCRTGLNVRHVGERFQRSNETVAK